MRRTGRFGLLFATMFAALLLAGGAALAAVIDGTGGDDVIQGTASGDSINSLGGDDTVVGMAGSDVVNGSDGDDVLRGAGESDELPPDGGNTVSGGSGDDAIWGGAGADDLRGGEGADTITEGPENDASRDEAYGGDGDDEIDVISIPARLDVVDCGPGADHVEADALDQVSANCESVNRLTSGEFQAAANPGRCELFRTYGRTSIGDVRLRWGDRSFGYRHIRDKHGFRSKRIEYTMNYGSVVEQSSPTRQTFQARYPGDQYPTRVVYENSRSSDRCPGVELGIITAYYKRR